MKTITFHLRRAAAVLLLCMLGSAGAWAQDEALGIVVWMNDDSKTEVLFSDMPEFTYAGGYVTLQSNNPSTSLSWPIENLKKLTFEQVSTGIRGIEVDGLDILSDNLTVYDLNGRLVKKNVKSLSELPKGVYLVKDGSVTIKVVRK
ncbi:MAG: T9SS type A sorting domain-containing protein [Prevotella sp.]|nr:T9SS type A sorting domain-containing protein [Prevotella sp.]